MPEKWDPVSGPTQKLVSLFCLLLFTGRTYSLTQLAGQLDCSKQTVLRLVETLEAQRWVKLKSFKEGGQRWFRVATYEKRPNFSFTPDELMQLALCRDLVVHLLPEGLRETVGTALCKTGMLLKEGAYREKTLTPKGGAHAKGSVDYTPFQGMVESLLVAIRDNKVCSVTYHALKGSEPKTYLFAPMRLVSYRDALYLEGYQVAPDGSAIRDQPTSLAIHRLQEVFIEGIEHSLSAQQNARSDHFGFMPGAPFKVKVCFDERVARYVSERVWSADQKQTVHDDNSITLEFSATNLGEVVSWLFSFGRFVEALEPETLREEMAKQSMLIAKRYQEGHLVC